MKKKKLQYRNQKWHELKERVKKRDNYKCVECGRDNKSAVLQVHHLRYIDGEVWESPMDDLVTLCKSCHAIEHGIIDPNKGWILDNVYDNEDCSYTCERNGCNTPIRYEQHIYHPKVGTKIVGSECVKHLTSEDQEIVKKITRITSSANSFIKKFRDSYDSFCFRIFRDISRGEARSRFYKKYPCITADYRSSMVDIIDAKSDNHHYKYLCLFLIRIDGSSYKYSYYVNCDNIKDCMRFTYYMIRGIKDPLEKDIELKIIKNIMTNYEFKKVQISQKITC